MPLFSHTSIKFSHFEAQSLHFIIIDYNFCIDFSTNLLMIQRSTMSFSVPLYLGCTWKDQVGSILIEST